ncbi:hypothetical protein LCGC14_1049030 [marine sediment metagenome]|uniref:Uncharacterized protein n=1 Tax=marine sediment metagenome TaxID=412755 RepID=A0A0F9QVG5_9ZZZZ
MADRLYCKQPDRNCPGLVCGYPLPCPWHTVVIEEGIAHLPPEIPADPEVVSRVIEVAKVLDDGK